MKTRSCKAKGRRLQNKIAKELAELFGLELGKEKDIWPRVMGEDGPDIALAKHIREIIPLSIECKNQEKWNVHSFVEQAKKQAYPNTEWVVIMSRNYQREPFVVVSWKFFKFLLKKAYGNK